MKTPLLESDLFRLAPGDFINNQEVLSISSADRLTWGTKLTFRNVVVSISATAKRHIIVMVQDKVEITWQKTALYL